METEMNTPQMRYEIYNFTPTVSLVSTHYMIKLKLHKIAHFEVSHRSILLA